MYIHPSRRAGHTAVGRLQSLCWRIMAALALVLVQSPAFALPTQAAPVTVPVDAPATAPTAAPATISLVVRNYDTKTPIPEFTYLVNIDNAADPHDPDPMKHPAVHPMPSYSPIAAAGDQTTAGSIVLDSAERYLISVRAPGYKQWGQHVRNPLNGTTVTIELIPDPQPLSSIEVYVFRDFAPVNGFVDAPFETEQGGGGLPGFNIILADHVGQVTVDWFGNPLCTRYNGTPPNNPVAGSGGQCLTDANGRVVIENIPAGFYGLEAVPPIGNAEGWSQTSTSDEGTKVFDTWIEEGSDGKGAPSLLVVDPGQKTANFFAFTRAMDWGDPEGVPPGSGTITGRTVNYLAFPPFEQLVPEPNEPMPQPWIALTDLNTDRQVYRTRGDANGNFVINNVPPGTYQMTIWDEPQVYIIAFRTVVIGPGETINMGDVGVFRWRGWVSGHVFMDTDQDAIRDPGETGLPNQEVLIRYRDGSIHTGTFTKPDGSYEMPEMISPLLRFELAEVGFTNLARTGHSKHREQFAKFNIPDPNPVVVDDSVGGGLILSQLTIEGQRSVIDWGKTPYQGTDNGGISGIIMYATTRNEFNARLALAEDYEPGLPNVTVQLYGLRPGGDPENGDDYSVLLNEVQSDSWQTPRPSNPDNPAQCDVLDQFGNSLFTPGDGSTPEFVANNCIEVPQLGNETQPGAYDGGWAMETMCAPDANGVSTYPCDENAQVPLPPGNYVVEVVTPPFYQILKEEDLNTIEGNDLVPAIPPKACVGPLHLADVPDDYGSPYDGQMMPLCNRKFAPLQAQQNVGVDFFLFTDSDTDGDAATRNWTSDRAVAPPGLIFGLVENNVIIENDPDALTYGELRSAADLPIGIYEFDRTGNGGLGRRITTIYTDENGFYEVWLPSTPTANCPIPQGVCPAMYILVLNDPGDPGNPDPAYKGNYLIDVYVRDVWPGKMTVADTPTNPVSTQVCTLPAATPQIFVVDTPYGQASSGFNITITGTRFGLNQATPPIVTLGGTALNVVNWTAATPFGPDGIPNTADDSSAVFEDVVTVSVPAGFTAGPAQLIVTNTDSGNSTVNGLTVHVLGAGYNPPVVVVAPSNNPNATPLQNAINSAAPGSLIIVQPGSYRENIILGKRVKLQGYGPGGIVGAGDLEAIDCTGPNCPAIPPGGEEPFSPIVGTVLDGRYFAFEVSRQVAWQNQIDSLSPVGPAEVPGGAGITVVAPTTSTYNDTSFTAQIDGFAVSASRGQGGGGIYVHAYGRNLQITNNILEDNTGYHGGGISLGRPTAEDGLENNENDNIRMVRNRILSNGGVFFAGGLGIFNGADNYELGNNDICGNYSLEYGGGLSHFGFSPNAWIHDNWIYNNDSFDEGGGVIITGDLGVNPPLGSSPGPVTLERNLIQTNVSNDDGGGIQLLNPLQSPIRIHNNIIANNVAGDMGGGISLDNGSDVTIINNTIVGNLSTHTAVDAIFGEAHSAGLVTTPFSDPFIATLPPGSLTYGNPLLFNNIFWDNLAYRWDAPNLQLVPTAFIDLEVFTGAPGQCLQPRNSFLSVAYGSGANCNNTDASNIVGNPADLTGLTWANDPLFAQRLPASLLDIQVSPLRTELNTIFLQLVRPQGAPMGVSDFHLQAASPAVDQGVAVDPLGSGITAPCDDYDSEPRVTGAAHDMGADEVPGVLNPCGGPINQPPTVGAGPDQAITLPALATLDGTVTDDGLPGPVTTLWSVTSGPGTVTFGNANAIDTTASFSAAGTYVLRLTADDGGAPPVFDEVTIVVSDGPPPPTGDLVYVSSSSDGFVGGVTFSDEDIVAYDPTNDTWIMVLDGSALGIAGGEDIDAFSIQADGSILLSFDSPVDGLNGLGSQVDDSDVVRFTPTTSGDYSSGTFSMVLDGSTVGLTTNGEDVDAIGVTPDGRLVVSVLTNFNMPAANGGISGQDEDLIVFDATNSLWQLYLDGTGLGLNGGSEDVWGLDLDGASGQLYLSTQGAFSVNGASGTGADIFTCTATPTSLNAPITGCTFAIFWSGATHGFGSEIIDGLDIGPAVVTAPPPPASGDLVYVSSSSNGSVGGVNFNDEDVLLYNPTNQSWTMFFDSSQVGVIASEDIDAFLIEASGNLLLSFDSSVNGLNGISGPVEDSDVVRFTPTTPGNYTAGAFSMVLDGSDVGLTTNAEDVDAIGFTPDGRLIVSTLGNFGIPPANGGFNGQDEDLIVLNGTLGDTTSGTWQLYFDGTALGLGNGGSEDVWGIDLDGGVLYLSTQGNFSVNGVSGSGSDIFACTATPSTLNDPITSCAFASYWDGAAQGFGGEIIDAFEIIPSVNGAAVNAVALDAASDPLNGDTGLEHDDGVDVEMTDSVFLPLITSELAADDPLNGDVGLDELGEE